jgi:hypothetical protein
MKTRLFSGDTADAAGAMLRRAPGRFVMIFVLVVLTGLAFSAIGGARAADPEITSISPETVEAGTTARTVTVRGTHFLGRLSLTVTGPDGAVADYDEPAIQQLKDTSFVVAVHFPKSGRYNFVVTNADGGVSKAAIVTAKPSTTAPVISGVLPDRLQASPDSQTLTVQGQGFTPGLGISVTGPDGSVQDVPAGAIHDVRPTSVQLAVTLSTNGDYSIVAVSPTQGTSNTFGFRVGPRR